MLVNEIEYFQVEMQTPAELDAELAAKGKEPAGNDDCCSKE